LSDDAEEVDPSISPTEEIEVKYHLPEEEISLGPGKNFPTISSRHSLIGF